MSAKKVQASRRVSWPEKDHPGGGEFRLTWGRLAAIVGCLAAAIGAFPAYWSISDHWMNRVEIKEAMKSHADHDAGAQAWTQYGFAANRLEYLDDKQAECAAKRLTQRKLDAADAEMCGRYEAKQKTKQTEAAELKAKAQEATKEKS